MKQLATKITERKKYGDERLIFNEIETFEDDLDYHYQSVYQTVSNRRYLYRGSYSKRKHFDYLDAISPNSKQYNESEFLYVFWLTRASFQLLLEELISNRVFNRKSKRSAQPAAYQLLVFL